MSARVQNYALSNGLSIINTTAVGIYLTSADSTTYTAATVTNALANAQFSAGSAFGAPAASTTNGRQVSSVAISTGTITSTGIATGWAVVTGSTLLANGALSTPVTFDTTANVFSLASFTITLPFSST